MAAAIDHLATLEDQRLDLDRVTLLGHSAGGHLALWAAGRPNLPAGAPGALDGPRACGHAWSSRWPASPISPAPTADQWHAVAPCGS